jgi:hypothetical protein
LFWKEIKMSYADLRKSPERDCPKFSELKTQTALDVMYSLLDGYHSADNNEWTEFLLSQYREGKGFDINAYVMLLAQRAIDVFDFLGPEFFEENAGSGSSYLRVDMILDYLMQGKNSDADINLPEDLLPIETAAQLVAQYFLLDRYAMDCGYELEERFDDGTPEGEVCQLSCVPVNDFLDTLVWDGFSQNHPPEQVALIIGSERKLARRLRPVLQ